MKFVSFGDLNVDFYIRNNLLSFVNGGSVSSNIIANLANTFETKYISISGNDYLSKVASKSLTNLNIELINKPILKNTNLKFIFPKNETNICPYCDRRKGYLEDQIDIDYVLSNIDEEEKVIVDHIDIELLSKLNNEIYLCLSCIDSIEYFDIYDFKSLENKFEIILFTEKVYSYILNKFKIDSEDLYNILKPKLLIIHKQNKGEEYLTNDIVYTKELEIEKEEIDKSGAIEAFFAEIIKIYIKNNKELNEKVISLMHMKGCSIYNVVISNVGARTHLEKNYYVDNYEICICEKINIKNL